MKPPKTIEHVGDFLAVKWDDGHESFYPLESLRRNCPCAACRGETNVLSETKPMPKIYTERSFQLARWQPVGGYAIQPFWGDGHSAGIFSYDFLRNLCDCDECRARK
jgi:DUF971 family protein